MFFFTMVVIGTNEERRHELSTWIEEHKKEIDLKDKDMERVKSNGLVAT